MTREQGNASNDCLWPIGEVVLVAWEVCWLSIADQIATLSSTHFDTKDIIRRQGCCVPAIAAINSL
jgi:hypothetical protein